MPFFAIVYLSKYWCILHSTAKHSDGSSGLVVCGLQNKCEHYWPVDKQPMYYGELKVVILNETKSADWVITQFEVSMVSVANTNCKHNNNTFVIVILIFGLR